MTTYDPRDLLYALDVEADTLVFVPRAVVQEILATRAALTQCDVWGDARARLPAERYAQLVDLYVAPIHQPPPDGDALGDEITRPTRPWPAVSVDHMPDWIPEHVSERFGTRYDTMMSSGVRFAPEALDQILEALRVAGTQCQEDIQVLDVLDEWD